jgi:hypothetical protein
MTINGDINIEPGSYQKLHDLTILWMKANVDASQLTPEQLYEQYDELFYSMRDARAKVRENRNR